MFSANASQVSNDVKYIEDFCSVYLRTGTGSSQTVTTGVKENTGALVISKSRSAATDWAWYDTFRGATKELASNTTAAEITQSQGLTSFNTDGHTWGTLAKVNTSGATYVDFVLKPTPKFFDVVTYTGDGTANRTVAHNLGSVPGCIIVKRTDSASGWYVLHKDANMLSLQTTPAALSSATTALYFGDDTNVIRPTSTVFTIGSAGGINASGGQYVALVFAHNAGGFGLTGTDNVISCGSFTTDGSEQATVTLGYEPQWVLMKNASSVSNWILVDNMRGMSVSTTTSDDARLFADTSGAEATSNLIAPTATGFVRVNGDISQTWIYIAIRRGPMKTPTSGTSVFAPVAYTGNSTTDTILTSGFPVDLAINSTSRTAINADKLQVFPRLTGGAHLSTASTAAEVATSTILVRGFDSNTGIRVGNSGDINSSGQTYVDWMFRRAPGFFDVVCYTGTGSATTVTHNLGVAPELMIFKSRSAAGAWSTFSALTSTSFNSGELNSTIAFTPSGYSSGGELSAAPTSTTFSLGGSSPNNSGTTYVAYLSASCPGVSKCGSYTGTGTTQQINCGFTAGARFVLIKRTDSTGGWYVWDSARGIVAGNDPYLLLNSTAAEVTTTDYVDTFSSGFEISSTAPAAINANGGTFIYLAIA